MNNILGHCYCGAVEIIIKEYGDFVYTCHCDDCRRINSGPVLSVDPGPKENVDFLVGRCQGDGRVKGTCQGDGGLTTPAN